MARKSPDLELTVYALLSVVIDLRQAIITIARDKALSDTSRDEALDKAYGTIEKVSEILKSFGVEEGDK